MQTTGLSAGDLRAALTAAQSGGVPPFGFIQHMLTQLKEADAKALVDAAKGLDIWRDHELAWPPKANTARGARDPLPTLERPPNRPWRAAAASEPCSAVYSG